MCKPSQVYVKVGVMTREWNLMEDKYWEVETPQCQITLEPRPVHCDRGNWIAKLHTVGGSQLSRDIDGADLWPRYYFDLERAKLEIEAWLDNRRL
jgi:hypothetical protein